MDPASFYSSSKIRRVVLPPENHCWSDADDSDQSETNILADNSDDDPDYVPEIPSNRSLVIVPESDSESYSDGDESLDVSSEPLHPQVTPLPIRSSSTQNKRSGSVDRSCRGKNDSRTFNWVKKDIPVASVGTLPPFNLESETPLGYFQRYFDMGLIERIISETNLYSVQQTGASVNTNVSEVEQFCGVLIYMGIVSLPSYTDYWALSTRCDKIADIMSLKRFQKLRKFLHFVNNENASDTRDRLFKIRPVLDAVVRNCRQQEQESEFSIDEMMVPYKGTRAGNLRQYIQNKPHKWGFKIFVRAGVSGVIYDFLPYTGKGTLTEASAGMTLGIGGQVVVELCKTIPENVHARVYFDNFFCSIDLIIYLKGHGIDSLGTLRKNRLRNCPLEDEKSLLKKGRGSYDYRMDESSGVILVRWADNKVVCLASSFCGIEPLCSVKRWNSKEKKKVEVPCPSVVKQYNKHMGGVDLAGMLIELYRVPLKSRRWYLRLFGYVMDLCTVNAWLVYRRETPGKTMSLKQFRADIATGLMNSGKRKYGRPSLETTPPSRKRKTTVPVPIQDVQQDGVDHWPEHGPKGRCRHCKNGYSTVKCSKCNVVLCFVPKRNCFRAFHLK